VEETVTAGGYYGAWLRASFAGEDSTTRTAHLQHLLDGHLSSRVEEAKFEGVDDPEKPMVVHAIYSVRNAVGKNAGECNAPVPASWEKDYLQIAFVKNRQSSFRFIMPFELTSDVTVQLPAAPKESSLASLHGEGHSNYCDWEMKPSVKSDSSAQKVSLHFHFLAHTGIHGPEDYTQCYESWEQARTAWDARLVWPQAP
jgi:hypothetical protein